MVAPDSKVDWKAKFLEKSAEAETLQKDFLEFQVDSGDLESALDGEIREIREEKEKLKELVKLKEDEIQELARFQKSPEQDGEMQNKIDVLLYQVQGYKEEMETILGKQTRLEQMNDDHERMQRIKDAKEKQLKETLDNAIESKVFLETEFEEFKSSAQRMIMKLREQMRDLQSEIEMSSQSSHSNEMDAEIQKAMNERNMLEKLLEQQKRLQALEHEERTKAEQEAIEAKRQVDLANQKQNELLAERDERLAKARAERESLKALLLVGVAETPNKRRKRSSEVLRNGRATLPASFSHGEKGLLASLRRASMFNSPTCLMKNDLFGVSNGKSETEIHQKPDISDDCPVPMVDVQVLKKDEDAAVESLRVEYERKFANLKELDQEKSEMVERLSSRLQSVEQELVLVKTQYNLLRGESSMASSSSGHQRHWMDTDKSEWRVAPSGSSRPGPYLTVVSGFGLHDFAPTHAYCCVKALDRYGAVVGCKRSESQTNSTGPNWDFSTDWSDKTRAHSFLVEVWSSKTIGWHGFLGKVEISKVCLDQSLRHFPLLNKHLKEPGEHEHITGYITVRGKPNDC
eukprot:65655_1